MYVGDVNSMVDITSGLQNHGNPLFVVDSSHEPTDSVMSGILSSRLDLYRFMTLITQTINPAPKTKQFGMWKNLDTPIASGFSYGEYSILDPNRDDNELPSSFVESKLGLFVDQMDMDLDIDICHICSGFESQTQSIYRNTRYYLELSIDSRSDKPKTNIPFSDSMSSIDTIPSLSPQEEHHAGLILLLIVGIISIVNALLLCPGAYKLKRHSNNLALTKGKILSSSFKSSSKHIRTIRKGSRFRRWGITPSPINPTVLGVAAAPSKDITTGSSDTSANTINPRNLPAISSIDGDIMGPDGQKDTKDPIPLPPPSFVTSPARFNAGMFLAITSRPTAASEGETRRPGCRKCALCAARRQRERPQLWPILLLLIVLFPILKVGANSVENAFHGFKSLGYLDSEKGTNAAVMINQMPDLARLCAASSLSATSFVLKGGNDALNLWIDQAGTLQDLVVQIDGAKLIESSGLYLSVLEAVHLQKRAVSDAIYAMCTDNTQHMSVNSGYIVPPGLVTEILNRPDIDYDIELTPCSQLLDVPESFIIESDIQLFQELTTNVSTHSWYRAGLSHLEASDDILAGLVSLTSANQLLAGSLGTDLRSKASSMHHISTSVVCGALFLCILLVLLRLNRSLKRSQESNQTQFRLLTIILLCTLIPIAIGIVILLLSSYILPLRDDDIRIVYERQSQVLKSIGRLLSLLTCGAQGLRNWTAVREQHFSGDQTSVDDLWGQNYWYHPGTSGNTVMFSNTGVVLSDAASAVKSQYRC
eukprot:gnl/Dysnectes_brevis/9155_a16806_176.p1 GENE.gnl/Dysnectes_brevis/9155_a16806_176~~gnl/Dysnectes_brevis/9155_a16806_176.p1  ORF type:complete len:763 (-),score=28.18 gnl/Dysnectes_brevis/9155_a16806_176:14-2302(-)